MESDTDFARPAKNRSEGVKGPRRPGGHAFVRGFVAWMLVATSLLYSAKDSFARFPGVAAVARGARVGADGAAPSNHPQRIMASRIAANEPGFESLFDGETFSGWRSHEGFSFARKEAPGGRWWIEGGALVGSPGPATRGGFLWLERPFADFILKLEVKLDYPIDSGVFLRVGPTGRSHQVMLDYLPPAPHIGAIFVPFHRFVHRNPEGIRALRPNEWNDLEIRLEGEPARIRVWLNGTLITDFQHDAESTQGVPRQGGIAFQVHPPTGNASPEVLNNTVRYRNIRIRKLPSPSVP